MCTRFFAFAFTSSWRLFPFVCFQVLQFWVELSVMCGFKSWFVQWLKKKFVWTLQSINYIQIVLFARYQTYMFNDSILNILIFFINRCKSFLLRREFLNVQINNNLMQEYLKASVTSALIFFVFVSRNYVMARFIVFQSHHYHNLTSSQPTSTSIYASTYPNNNAHTLPPFSPSPSLFFLLSISIHQGLSIQRWS